VYAVPDPDRGFVPDDRPLYNRKNAFFTAHDLQRMIAGLDRSSKERLVERVDNLSATYNDLSAAYQQDKDGNAIPLK